MCSVHVYRVVRFDRCQLISSVSFTSFGHDIYHKHKSGRLCKRSNRMFLFSVRLLMSPIAFHRAGGAGRPPSARRPSSITFHLAGGAAPVVLYVLFSLAETLPARHRKADRDPPPTMFLFPA